MEKFTTPGIYVRSETVQISEITLSKTGICAFFGICNKGPLTKLIKIDSFRKFREIFGGSIPDGYLEMSIKGFFENGGEECYVLRIAHTQIGLRNIKDEDFAEKASVTVNDLHDRPLFKINASNEGKWGNQIVAKVLPCSKDVKNLLTLDLQKGATNAIIKSKRGFIRGSIVKISDNVNEEFIVIDRVSGKRITWAREFQLKNGYKSSTPTYLEALEFDLHISDGAVFEEYVGLTTDKTSVMYFQKVINQSSKLISAEDLHPETTFYKKFPKEGLYKLANGKDGIDFISPVDFIGQDLGPGARYGFFALEEVEEVDLICIPDLMYCFERSKGFKTEKDVEIVHDAVIEHCEKMRDRIVLLDFPKKLMYNDIIRWRHKFDSPFAAFYYPWLIRLEEGLKKVVPPCGYVAGLFAKTDREVGLHKTPANVELEGVIDLDVLLSPDDLGNLYSIGINCIQYFPNRGMRVWGGKTTCSDPQWEYINIRRIFNIARRDIFNGTQWSVFETNNPELWRKIYRHVVAYLRSLWNRGFLVGATQEEAFYVKCDKETNTAEAVDAGQIITEIGISPVKPAEYLVFTISHTYEDIGSRSE